jgi:hypothetical protein
VTPLPRRKRIRAAECGNGDPKQRGPNCRQRETEEQIRREALATTLANKAASDRATSLDSAAAVIRARLATALPVQNPNPLGAALALLLGAGAAALTAWQQAIVAAVFELCLVGVMVIYELLGHVNPPSDRGDESYRSVGETVSPRPVVATKALATTSPKNKVGSVKTFVRDRLFPADGERTEIKVLMQNYRAWCVQHGFAPMALNTFLDEIEKLCSKLGIEIDVGDDQRVYCVGVRLSTAADGLATAVH